MLETIQKALTKANVLSEILREEYEKALSEKDFSRISNITYFRGMVVGIKCTLSAYSRVPNDVSPWQVKIQDNLISTIENIQELPQNQRNMLNTLQGFAAV